MKNKFLLTLAIPLFFVACEDTAKVARAIDNDGKKIADLKSKIEKKAIMLEERATLTSAIAREEENAALLLEEQVSLEEKAYDLSDSIVLLSSHFNDYRSLYVSAARSHAVGETYEVFTSLSGSSFSNVSITSVTDVGIEFSHASGRARLRHLDLPGDMRDRFQWDAEKARQVTAREEESYRLAASASDSATRSTRSASRKSSSSRQKSRRSSRSGNRRAGALDSSTRPLKSLKRIGSVGSTGST